MKIWLCWLLVRVWKNWLIWSLKSRLDALGVPCEYYRFPLWPHTMDIAKRVNDFSQKKMGDFFARYL